MSSDLAIQVRNLSKIYPIFQTPRHRLMQMFYRGRRRFYQEFTALNDVSFEVQRGETLGIVGKNGSGKSTLLQIICNIVTPTSGEVKIQGRVGALLELGAGFNREFTGRENVFMYGAILGIPQKEIQAIFSDIVDFAEIGPFIDQPVKTYSSGMFVRLAFSVAINVDPDILVVDEALAVGDEAFQRKCYARIKNVQEAGCTVLFVSHAAQTVVELCNRVLLLDNGELLMVGDPSRVVENYHKLLYAPKEELPRLRNSLRLLPGRELPPEHISDNASRQKPPSGTPAESGDSHAYFDPNLTPKSTLRYPSRGALIEDPHITDLQGNRVNNLINREEYVFCYQVRFERPANNVRCGMKIKTTTGYELGGMTTARFLRGIPEVQQGQVMNLQFRFRCLLVEGFYFLNCGLVGLVEEGEEFLDRIVDSLMFRVQPPQLKTIEGGPIDFLIQSNVSFEK